MLPHGLLLALLIVLAAGLSLAVGQAVVLFINRVQPIRFCFSLIISAVLYAFGFLFLTISTWLICLVPWSVHVPFVTLFKVFGLSYAPLLLSFLGALPYLGVPILSLLSSWHLLVMVVGFSAVAGVSLKSGFGHVVLGWLVLQLSQQIIGQPIANLGHWLSNLVAGVNLVTRRRELSELVRMGLTQASSPIVASARNPLPEAQRLIQTARQRFEGTVANVQSSLQERSIPTELANASIPEQATRLINRATSSKQRSLLLAMGVVGIVLLAYVVAVLLQPLRNALFGRYEVPQLLQFGLDLVWMGIVAIAVAGLLAPLETLGWWAGWYNDEVDTTINTGRLTEPLTHSQTVNHYILYLDGIGQSSFEYLPDIEDFLDALTPALPEDTALIRGLMVYSVLNNPLDEDRPLTFLWKLADKLRFANPTSLLGLLINLRNVLIVSVSADQRYGPLYNQGIAQVMYNSLINNGYQPGSGVPITLIGYSGGGQMSCAAAPFLKRVTGAPIDVISLGGVISGNCNILKLEHLYHLKGTKDNVETLGPIMFPGRWPIFRLSYWNRAKRLGKISFVSLGPVGHQVPGGMLDPKAYLPDGRSHLQHTIDTIVRILEGKLLQAESRIPQKPSNYELYKQAAFNDPAYYPIQQTPDLNWYRPIGAWMGRLILPAYADRAAVRGVLFEVYRAGAGYEGLVGQTVKLRWVTSPVVQQFVKSVTRDVHFNAEAEHSSEHGGLIHPERLNHWRQVDPLESLAGSHPTDDLTVMLEGEVSVEVDASSSQAFVPASLPTTTLRIQSQPVQITGRYYALVRFLQPAGSDRFRVVHFNSGSRQFDGMEETVRLPQVVANQNGCLPSTTAAIERSPLNETGWYIYGAQDANGMFVVQAYAPRSLLRLQPDQVLFGRKAAYRYIRQQAWADIASQKGKISSVLLSPTASVSTSPIQTALDEWQEGDRALVLHTYGGIGGKKREPAAASPLFFGHFAYGLAKVVRDPLADELRFEIQYYHVYTHNTDGLVAGTLHWSRYMGDRQFGWAGVRPICDILIKQDVFVEPFEINGKSSSALNFMLAHLQLMTARYRIGDGTGGTYVGPANNCSQDSNQALFASLRNLKRAIEADADYLQNWLLPDSAPAQRYQQLLALSNALQRQLQPFGAPRSDWENNEFNLGSTLEDAPLRNLCTGLGSWRTLLPRFASDTIVRIFLKYNASVWVLRTTQIGGFDPEIEPIAPITL
jgi:predicted Abi (CAAX) family protease